jgi:hypothetical protein
MAEYTPPFGALLESHRKHEVLQNIGFATADADGV